MLNKTSPALANSSSLLEQPNFQSQIDNKKAAPAFSRPQKQPIQMKRLTPDLHAKKLGSTKDILLSFDEKIKQNKEYNKKEERKRTIIKAICIGLAILGAAIVCAGMAMPIIALSFGSILFALATFMIAPGFALITVGMFAGIMPHVSAEKIRLRKSEILEYEKAKKIVEQPSFINQVEKYENEHFKTKSFVYSLDFYRLLDKKEEIITIGKMILDLKENEAILNKTIIDAKTGGDSRKEAEANHTLLITQDKVSTYEQQAREKEAECEKLIKNLHNFCEIAKSKE